MDRIKTRIIIAVAERLSAAKDSNAKTDLIEELSENLYQRYADLVAGGMSEEDSYLRAMEDLGDVSELLDYLEDMENGESCEQNRNQNKEHLNDFLKGVEDVVRETLVQAKDAVDQAKIITRDLGNKFQEKYPDGIKINCGFDSGKGGFFWESNRKGHIVEIAKLPAEQVKALDIQLHSGDLNISVAAQESVEVSGRPEGEIEVRLDDNGILYIRQGTTASSTVAFGRGLARTDVELTLPDKVWEFVRINTINGDVELEDMLEANELSIQTSSGDICADRACCPQITLRSISGDIDGEDLAGNVLADSKSGDITLSGKFVEVKANSISGDLDVSGTANAVYCSSMSGDVNVNGAADIVHCSSMSGDVDAEIETLPRELHAESKSGDCCVRIPDGQGFHVSLRTVSGDMNTEFELVGTLGKKSTNAIYLDGGDRNFSISSISGDISLEKI
ncbi:MAG: DUF4097 family beta strand repeat protein [Oscillospiraceae bacterium]|nr:DUF4097 family beta strand repeat protein [Oscillospiraceae bacterium]